MGDGVQAIKAGILEIADVFAINKSDRDGASALEQELHADAPYVPIVRTIAHEGRGVKELLEAIERSRPDEARRVRLWRWRLREMLLERLASRVNDAQLAAAAEDVASGQRDPYEVVEEWAGS
jgi:LAO/AO transport system kinase